MEISYQFFEDECLLIQKISGLFSLEKYKTYSRSLFTKYASKEVKKVLLDLRDLQLAETASEIPVKFEEDVDKVIEVRENFNEHELKDRRFRLVIWVDNPQSTVIAHIFVRHFPSKDYDYCSTAKIATRLLNLSSGFDDIETVMANLEYLY